MKTLKQLRLASKELRNLYKSLFEPFFKRGELRCNYCETNIATHRHEHGIFVFYVCEKCRRFVYPQQKLKYDKH